MPNYSYIGRDARGNKVNGIIEAPSKEAVAAQLFAKHITPLTIIDKAVGGQAKTTTRSSKSANFELKIPKFMRPRVKLEELAIFSQNISIMLDAGVPIVTAVKQLALTSSHLSLKESLEEIAEQLQAGQSLAKVIRQYPKVFPDLYANIIEVGESSGRLDESFAQLATYLQNDAATQKRIKSALRYPKIVVSALIAAVAVINVFVVPAFANFFKTVGKELPLPTRILIGMSDFFVHSWPYLIALIVIAVVVIRSFLRSNVGRMIWDRRKLQLPVFGQLLTHIMLTQFSWSFSLMLRSGVPLLQGLDLVAKSASNAYITDKIHTIKRDIEEGRTLTTAIKNSKLFSSMMMQMILVGEESGRTADMFEKIAISYEKHTDYTIQRFSDMLEPTLLIFMAGMVLVLALGIFLPMYGMMGK